jgi:hypothetical protein
MQPLDLFTNPNDLTRNGSIMNDSLNLHQMRLGNIHNFQPMFLPSYKIALPNGTGISGAGGANFSDYTSGSIGTTCTSGIGSDQRISNDSMSHLLLNQSRLSSYIDTNFFNSKYGSNNGEVYEDVTLQASIIDHNNRIIQQQQMQLMMLQQTKNKVLEQMSDQKDIIAMSHLTYSNDSTSKVNEYCYIPNSVLSGFLPPPLPLPLPTQHVSVLVDQEPSESDKLMISPVNNKNDSLSASSNSLNKIISIPSTPRNNNFNNQKHSTPSVPKSPPLSQLKNENEIKDGNNDSSNSESITIINENDNNFDKYYQIPSNLKA